MTRSTVFERVLELTKQQHRLKYQIDKLRGRADESARAQWQADKTRDTKWEIPGLGTVRLDGTSGEVTPKVTDDQEFASYVAERYAHEATATITLPAGQLEQALEALGYAEVKYDKAEVAVRPAFTTRILADVILSREEPAEEGAEPGPWFAQYVDPKSGVIERVPGVGVEQAMPKLVVVVSNEAKADVIAEAKAELAALDAATEQAETKTEEV